MFDIATWGREFFTALGADILVKGSGGQARNVIAGEVGKKVGDNLKAHWFGWGNDDETATSEALAALALKDSYASELMARRIRAMHKGGKENSKRYAAFRKCIAKLENLEERVQYLLGLSKLTETGFREEMTVSAVMYEGQLGEIVPKLKKLHKEAKKELGTRDKSIAAFIRRVGKPQSEDND